MSAWDGTEKEIYETQLRTLQEQLVDSMIENQTLGKETWLSVTHAGLKNEQN